MPTQNHITRRRILTAIPLGTALATIAVSKPAASGQGQPHMANALEALQTAKRELNNAVADKGGHRVKAIDLVNQAITEVKLGMAAANPG